MCACSVLHEGHCYGDRAFPCHALLMPSLEKRLKISLEYVHAGAQASLARAALPLQELDAADAVHAVQRFSHA